jgi:ABC-2 type transport system ATP-binding protein
VQALSDLTLEVRNGEVFGFLGLNGAGKTTTIRLILDLVRATGGSASIFGHDCRHDSLAARRLVGYLPGDPSFFPDMTGARVLSLLERVGEGRVRKEWREELLERLDLPCRDLSRRIRDYSTGMKRKLGIVQAMQHDPPLLILDEPTESLDPLMQERLYGLLAEVTSRGRTVFLSSHVLSEVERICGRVALLRAGKLVLVSPVEDLRALAPRRVTVRFEREVHTGPPELPEVTVLAARPRAWELELRGPMGALVARLPRAEVSDLEVHEARLEDIVLRYYRGQERER